MVVGNVVDGEDGAVLFRRPTFRPKRGEILREFFFSDFSGWTGVLTELFGGTHNTTTAAHS